MSKRCIISFYVLIPFQLLNPPFDATNIDRLFPYLWNQKDYWNGPILSLIISNKIHQPHFMTQWCVFYFTSIQYWQSMQMLFLTLKDRKWPLSEKGLTDFTPSINIYFYCGIPYYHYVQYKYSLWLSFVDRVSS